MPNINIQTHRGTFQIDTDQIVGVEKVTITGPDGSQTEGTNVLISIGVIPKPRTEVMRSLADAIEQANARVVPVSRLVLPGRGEG